jgi:hypothetical protein
VRILTGSERNAEQCAPKVLIIGVPGIGKTSRLNDLSPAMLSTTLFVDSEAGDLAIAGLDVATIRPRTWSNARDIVCALSGPDPALPSTAAYSQTHFDSVIVRPQLAELTRYSTVFVDSITDLSRRCRTWAEQQPESFTERGRNDSRGMYGLIAREMTALLLHLQHAREKTIILVGVLELATDDFGHRDWRIQLQGQATGRQLPAIVDEVICLHAIDFGDGKLTRAFICTHPNAWGLPAKDRSGKLQQVEEPHLGKLLEKLTAPKGE